MCLDPDCSKQESTKHEEPQSLHLSPPFKHHRFPQRFLNFGFPMLNCWVLSYRLLPLVPALYSNVLSFQEKCSFQEVQIWNVCVGMVSDTAHSSTAHLCWGNPGHTMGSCNRQQSTSISVKGLYSMSITVTTAPLECLALAFVIMLFCSASHVALLTIVLITITTVPLECLALALWSCCFVLPVMLLSCLSLGAWPARQSSHGVTGQREVPTKDATPNSTTHGCWRSTNESSFGKHGPRQRGSQQTN